MVVEIIRQHKFSSLCFIGGPNDQYWLSEGCAPEGRIPGEVCIKINPAELSVQRIMGDWSVIEFAGTEDHAVLSFPDKADAKLAIRIIKKYNFNYICFVGRPYDVVTYYLK